MTDSQVLDNINRKLSAVVAILSDLRERAVDKQDKSAQKTEALLNGAGLKAPEIAELMGKNLDAVRKTLQRSR